jgi:hypothetical protein
VLFNHVQSLIVARFLLFDNNTADLQVIITAPTSERVTPAKVQPLQSVRRLSVNRRARSAIVVVAAANRAPACDYYPLIIVRYPL